MAEANGQIQMKRYFKATNFVLPNPIYFYHGPLLELKVSSELFISLFNLCFVTLFANIKALSI